ncbi:MAG: hypothetical protein JRJ79_07700 [Deltaproteobacteria bacterium]|nr:hypothetical protein [Deltaproteobacteria bacterium]
MGSMICQTFPGTTQNPSPRLAAKDEDEDEGEDEDEEYNEDNPKPLTCNHCGHDVDPDQVAAYVKFDRAYTGTRYEVDEDGDYTFYVLKCGTRGRQLCH